MSSPLAPRLDALRRALDARPGSTLARVVAFGSVSYGDFVPAFSDVDLFASFATTDAARILEEIPPLKRAAEGVFGAKNVDVTFAKEAELVAGRTLLNPLIWATIRSGVTILGDDPPDLFTAAQLRDDAWYVAGGAVRDLRSLVSRMFAPRPVLLLRSCDEALFKGTRALVAALTGVVHGSRRDIVVGLQRALPGVDVAVFERMLEVRAGLATAGGRDEHARYDELVLSSMLAFEEIYARGRLEAASA